MEGKDMTLSILMRSVASILLVAGITHAHFAWADDWPAFRFDAARTGYNPNETTLGTQNVANLRVKWIDPTKGFIATSPAVVKSVVYVASLANQVHAFDAETGHIILGDEDWRSR